MKHLEAVLTALAMALIGYLVYTSYCKWADCKAKGGIYLPQQFLCIKAEVL